MGNRPTYVEVVELIKRHGGSMEPHPGGYGGGVVWHLELHGKHCEIECRSHTVTALDQFYVPNKPAPQTWNDYDKPDRLKPDGFWRMVALPWR